MIPNPFISQNLLGRQAEFQQVCQVLAADGDLLLAGVPGSGRRTLLRFAAEATGCRVVEIDCLRATDSTRFLELLAEAILTTFQTPEELAFIQRWSLDQPFVLQQTASRSRLLWHAAPKNEWLLFQTLLALPQRLAEWLNIRIVMVLQNFPHIRSWDRSEKWQTYLRQEIQRQSRVSYALIATVAERWVQHSNMQVVFLGPLKHEDLHQWLITTMAGEGLKLEPDQALPLFLDYVQGHVGDAIALARRIWLDYRALQCEEIPIDAETAALDSQEARERMQVQVKQVQPGTQRDPYFKPSHAPLFSTRPTEMPTETDGPSSKPESRYAPLSAPYSIIHPHHVHRSALGLVEDLSLTFESLVLLLPPSQVRVLESLALDPTPSPHSREYIQKHQLSRGGGLQGALASLEQKGLVYGPEYSYQITLPLLGFWLRQRLA